MGGADTYQEARRALLEMAEQFLAFVTYEAQARASDTLWGNRSQPIDPHVLSAALHSLIAERRLQSTKEATRGRRSITVFQPANLEGRQRAAKDAAARKRLVYTRYLSWAQGTTTQSGITGPAGERVLHRTLRHTAGSLGYKLENFEGGKAATVLGVPVASGPLDNAAHLYLGDPSTRYTVLFESKSKREWVYHTSDVLYQVLYKAAVLQQQLPNAAIVPVLVCRRAHITAFRLVKDVGGYIIEARGQWVPRLSRVTDKALRRVRSELNFVDLDHEPENGLSRAIARQLTVTLPAVLARQAERWKATGGSFAEQYLDLWRHGDRARLAEVRRQMSGEAWFEGGW